MHCSFLFRLLATAAALVAACHANADCASAAGVR
jgi:hypothetical protein